MVTLPWHGLWILLFQHFLAAAMCREIQVYIPNSPSLPSAWFHPGASLSLSLCGWGHNARSAWQKSTTCQKKHHSLGVSHNLYPEKIENCQNKKINHYITTTSNFGGSASCFSATPSFSKTPSSLRMLRPWTLSPTNSVRSPFVLRCPESVWICSRSKSTNRAVSAM